MDCLGNQSECSFSLWINSESWMYMFSTSACFIYLFISRLTSDIRLCHRTLSQALQAGSTGCKLVQEFPSCWESHEIIQLYPCFKSQTPSHLHAPYVVSHLHWYCEGTGDRWFVCWIWRLVDIPGVSSILPKFPFQPVEMQMKGCMEKSPKWCLIDY